jgi:hypothetical protein
MKPMPKDTPQVDRVPMFWDATGCKWTPFMSAEHERNTREDGSYEVRDFYPAAVDQQVDHKAGALDLLDALCGYSTRAEAIAMAQVHASLAIAEGQERVADEIKAFRELMAGSAT